MLRLPQPAEFVVDASYPQKVVEFLPLELPVCDYRRLLRDPGGRLWVVARDGVAVIAPDDPPTLLGACAWETPVSSAVPFQGGILVGGADGLQQVHWDGSRIAWQRVADSPEPVVDLAGDGESCVVLLPSQLARWQGGAIQVFAELAPFKRGVVVCLQPGSETIWVGTDRGLGRWRPDGWQWFTYAGTGLPTNHIRDLQLDPAGFLWVATPSSTVIFNGDQGWYRLGCQVLTPYGDTTAILLGADGAAWLGTPRGLLRLHNGRWDVYAGRRWLLDDQVQALASDGQEGVWVASPGGLSRLGFRAMTLEEKAAHVEIIRQRRHHREGWVAGSSLQAPGDLESWTQEASDNDGLRTALYVAAESFRYAATGCEEARTNLAPSLKALAFLEEVTPIAGFPARAARRVQEGRSFRSGGEWHPTEDGQWEWKGDTSSDEIGGHFFGYAVCYDLAADEGQRVLIREKIRRISDHIIANDFVLRDVDGERTQWGVWRPDLLNRDEGWRPERGLNSLEILSFLTTAYHIVGDDIYQELAHRLAFEEHYALNLIEQYNTDPEVGAYHDNQLAFMAYFNLLRYEADPVLRRYYLLSLERTWRQVRGDRATPWNLIYGLLTGRPCDVAEAVDTLRDVPLDLVRWSVDNTWRWDLPRHPQMPLRTTQAIRPSERDVINWDGSPFNLLGGAGGRAESDGVFFLLPYWMGRYYGLIRKESPLPASGHPQG